MTSVWQCHRMTTSCIRKPYWCLPYVSCSNYVKPPPPMTPQTTARDQLETVRSHLLTHCCDKLSLESLARLAGIGRYQLIRLFNRHFGMTPHAMQLDMRINLARNLLGCGTTPAEVAYRTGFADQSHFHRAFKARVAATPAQYQRTTG